MSKSVTSPDPTAIPPSSQPDGSSPLPSSSPPPAPLAAPLVAPPPEDFSKPGNITGGCLCGVIRYSVDFPPDHKFLKSCRKHTGTLVFYTHTVPAASMYWIDEFALVPSDSRLAAPLTLRHHSTADGCRRGFCNACGSTIYWEDEKRTDRELALGTVDAKFLIGGYGEPGRATSTAPPVPTTDGYGFALANCSGDNKFCDNEIRRVTDGLAVPRGRRWRKDVEPEGQQST
ncbi:hypothetical protein PG991_000406 [Apiospora marii]|uniref:CENP-V/GFA domain-containing protein n=1 Tax=Apiospora marii TaxID=335849 RepID=A0ABR1T216_9PEZI